MAILRKAFSVLFSFMLFFISNADKPQKENYIEPTSTKTFIMLDAFARCQGITTDGEHFYFSSNSGLMKTELDGETVIKEKFIALPAQLMIKGCDHIGGISYYDGKIYATCEDSNRFKNLYLLVYDAETLDLIKYTRLDCDLHEDGAPWVAVDKQTGLVYTARQAYFEQLNVYDSETLEFMYTLPVTGKPHKIQGGEIYNGVLYCGASRQNQAIFSVDLSTGEGKLFVERNLNDKNEGEDLTLLVKGDSVEFVCLDISSIRVGVNIRTYNFDI